MERLEEYAQEESPGTETGNLPRDPIPKDLIFQFLRVVTNCKRLKNWNGVCKVREWKDSEGSRRAESNANWKVLNWG